ncbi:MAG: hypothetical protein JWP59_3320 [Massilia sp.]|nr:hypothetical protein [Massilia sp.]
MPYNGGMTDLTLVVPFSLPPAELAADLVRALKAPNLAALLSRSASFKRSSVDGAGRSLPHERWLAAAMDLPGPGLPFATAVMRGFQLDPGADNWLIVHPVHIEIARTHLLMSDMRRINLVESHARALYDSARPYFDEDGHTLLYGDAGTWFMRAAPLECDWADLDTASPDATGGMNLTDSMPLGAAALAYRKLQNEVQMLWHHHPANAEREARGLPAINGFWPWGAARGQAAPFALASANAPAWLAALGTSVHGPFAAWLDQPGRAATFLEAALIGPALAGDWADWLQQMARIDSELLAPALAAVKAGMKLELVLSHRSGLVEANVTAMSQRSFWRSHSLERLLG